MTSSINILYTQNSVVLYKNLQNYVNNCTEARRAINEKEKKIRATIADLRSTDREISREQAGKLINGSGIVIDCWEIILLPNGQLRYCAGTTEKMRLDSK